jgi:hypothetical protein
LPLRESAGLLPESDCSYLEEGAIGQVSRALEQAVPELEVVYAAYMKPFCPLLSTSSDPPARQIFLLSEDFYRGKQQQKINKLIISDR